jgi:hypothetical protein
MRSPILIVALVTVAVFATSIAAQTPDPDEGLTVRGSSVGYIDTAAIGNQIFFRSDFGYRFSFPNRAELFYAQGQPAGPGLPRPERSVDFQELLIHVEYAFNPRVSGFVEQGARFLNPEVNTNAAGANDLALGIKHALISDSARLLTFQLRVFTPTGDASKGLGTRHVSLEPALLGYRQLNPRLGLAGEFRCWTPIGGTDFQSVVLRYGLGLRYNLWHNEKIRIAPTLETIGWTVLSGNQSQLNLDGSTVTQSAAGASIVNMKIGARVDIGSRLGAYMGYGRAITGEQWYAHVLRMEARWLY